MNLPGLLGIFHGIHYSEHRNFGGYRNRQHLLEEYREEQRLWRRRDFVLAPVVRNTGHSRAPAYPYNAWQLQMRPVRRFGYEHSDNSNQNIRANRYRPY